MVKEPREPGQYPQGAVGIAGQEGTVVICLTPEQIELLARDALEADEAATLRRHVDQCDVCHRKLDECQANESDGPIGINDSFSGGAERPPQHPNCRCAVTYFKSDDQYADEIDKARERAEATAGAKGGAA